MPEVVARRREPDPFARAPALFAGVAVANLTQDETVDFIERCIREKRLRRMAVVNAAILLDAEKNADFRAVLQESDLVTADGMAVVWASRLSARFGGRLIERVTGPDTVTALAARAARFGWRLYLLGAQPGVAERAAHRLRRDFPGLRIVGCHDGYFDRDRSDAVAEAIRLTGADALLAAMGSPEQELWLHRYGAKTGVAFCLGVGGCFDVLAGARKRAPAWAQRVGLEWLFRFLQEPRRLWRRYLIGNVQFLFFLLREWKRARHNVKL